MWISMCNLQELTLLYRLGLNSLPQEIISNNTSSQYLCLTCHLNLPSSLYLHTVTNLFFDIKRRTRFLQCFCLCTNSYSVRTMDILCRNKTFKRETVFFSFPLVYLGVWTSGYFLPLSEDWQENIDRRGTVD